MGSLSEQAYTHIQQLILNGKLQSGSVITEAEIAEVLGMSRTPVGEAIRQLVSEGLVEQMPRKGAILRTFDRRDLIDLFEMRQAVESFAAEKAADRITAKQIDKLVALSNAMKKITEAARSVNGSGPVGLSDELLQRLLSADMAFHMLILQVTGNARLQRAIADTRLVFSVFRMQRPILDLRIVEQAHDEHELIIAAFKDRKRDVARSTMEKHIVASRDHVLKELDMEASQSRVNEEFTLPEDLRAKLEEIENGNHC